MSAFDDLKQKARDAATALEAARTERAAARENLKRHDAEVAGALRRAGGAVQDPAGIAQRRGELATKFVDGHADLKTKAGLARNVFTRFVQLDPPSKLIEHWDAGVPILLLPVRLETRFMKSAAGADELWVRVYPDEISVASFEAQLSRSEVEAAERFWADEWRASTDEGRRLGTWRVLRQSVGAARAEYVVSIHKPTNPAARPALPLAADAALPVDPTYAAYEPSADGWNEAPRALALPERWSFIGYTGGQLVFNETGNAIRPDLVAGPDPSGEEADGFALNGGRLTVAESMKWMVDFDEAIDAGMGFKIPLPAAAAAGFDRLFVVGLRFQDDATEAPATVASLLRAHRFSANQLAIVPNGAPTNNTGENEPYPLMPTDEASLQAALGAPFVTQESSWLNKRDGQYLAELLALPLSAVERIHGAGGFDQRDARAMNTALWPATLGYFLDEMLAPRVSDADVRATRDFFCEHVRARGPAPVLRVGAQPYGLLPTTAFSLWQPRVRDQRVATTALFDRAAKDFESQLFLILSRMLAAWTTMSKQVSAVGRDADTAKSVLDILGLQASSAEFHQRYATGAAHIWNYLRLGGYDATSVRLYEFFVNNGRQLLQALGWSAEPPAAISDKVFFSRQTPIASPLIDDRPLSETDLLLPSAADGRNYLDWLATSTLDDIRVQRFGTGRTAPDSLLYQMLRHAAMLSLDEAATNLLLAEGLLPARPKEKEILYAGTAQESGRWERLYSKQPAITGSATQLVVDFLRTPATTPVRVETRPASEFGAATAALASTTTGRLERAFTEHIDLCSYRLDAWLTGLIDDHLARRRAPGLYLGAFGWLENVKPKNVPTTPVNVADVPTSFADLPLVEDPTNAGYVMAPSINHAVAAAVLRNAYINHADSSNPEAMSVNLSSARVRAALGILDGIRNGQSLGALLGYQFERGLHDRYGQAEVDKFVYPLRLKFPIKAGQLTPLPPGVTIAQVEARDVIDGLKLLEHVRKPGVSRTYPFDLTGLPLATTPQAAAIEVEVQRMQDAMDAVSDLCMTESVFQVVKGNYDRAGAMLKAVSEGNQPPEPEVVETPRSGVNVVERLVVQFETGLDATLAATNPYDGTIAMTPRAVLEPGLNDWLARMLPPLDRVAVHVGTQATPTIEDTVAISALGLQPIDLLWFTDATIDDHSALGRLFGSLFRFSQGLGDDVALRYDERFRDAAWGTDRFSWFEIKPLLDALKRVVADGRALAADDFVLPSDDGVADPKGWDLVEWRTRIDVAVTAFDTARGTLQTQRGLLAAQVAPFNAVVLNAARSALVTLLPLGFDDAIPRSTSGTSVKIRDALVQQMDEVLKQTTKRSADVTALLASVAAAAQPQNVLEQAVRVLFNGTVKSFPTFSYRNVAELTACHTDRVPLRRNASSKTSARDWLHSAARVHPRATEFEKAFTFSELFDRASLDITTWQLPWRKDDFWLAVEYPAAHQPSGENLLVNSYHAAPLAFGGNQAGLFIDDWTELIPNPRETAALSVHFDRPNSEPPQAMLLAVSPRVGGEWQWDDLMAILNETLDLARVRAVEPQQIDDSDYAQLLPATMAAVTRYLVTISLNYNAVTLATTV